jgi:hypothetical protein
LNNFTGKKMYKKKKFGSKTSIKNSKLQKEPVALQRTPETISSYFSTSVGSRSGFQIPNPPNSIPNLDPEHQWCGSVLVSMRIRNRNQLFTSMRIRIQGAQSGSGTKS